MGFPGPPSRQVSPNSREVRYAPAAAPVADEFTKCVLGCRLVQIPGPHLLAQDRPDEVAGHLLALLDS